MNTGATFHVSDTSCLSHKGIAQIIQVTSYVYLFSTSLVKTDFEPSHREGRKQFLFDLAPGKPPGEVRVWFPIPE